MKYRSKFNTHHLVVYLMAILLTIMIIIVWWNKRCMSMQALTGYIIVLIYAFYIFKNQSYVIVDSGFLIIVKGCELNKEERYKLSEIKSISYGRQNYEYYLEIEKMSVIYREKVSLLGEREINQLFKDLQSRGVDVRV